MLILKIILEYDAIFQPGIVSNKPFSSNVSTAARWIKKIIQLLQYLYTLFYTSDFIIDMPTAHFKSDY
jgi:hypothetical protein